MLRELGLRHRAAALCEYAVAVFEVSKTQVARAAYLGANPRTYCCRLAEIRDRLEARKR